MDADSLERELKDMKTRETMQGGAVHARLEELRDALDAHRQRERRLVELYEEEAIDLELYRQRRRALEREGSALAQEIGELEGKVGRGASAEIDVEDVVGRFMSLRDTWDHLSFPEKRQILRALIREIVVYPDGRLEITFNLIEGLDLPRETMLGDWREVRAEELPEPETVSAQLRRYRAVHRLNQEQLAAMLSVSTRTLSLWENGRRAPSDRSRALIEEKTDLQLVD
jgi:DNA-binding transcriptional regulator YiaG